MVWYNLYVRSLDMALEQKTCSAGILDTSPGFRPSFLRGAVLQGISGVLRLIPDAFLWNDNSQDRCSEAQKNFQLLVFFCRCLSSLSVS